MLSENIINKSNNKKHFSTNQILNINFHNTLGQDSVDN